MSRRLLWCGWGVPQKTVLVCLFMCVYIWANERVLCEYVHVCVCACLCVCLCVLVFMPVYVWAVASLVCVLICMHVCMWLFAVVCVLAHVHVGFKCVLVCIHVCVHLCARVCASVCGYPLCGVILRWWRQSSIIIAITVTTRPKRWVEHTHTHTDGL